MNNNEKFISVESEINLGEVFYFIKKKKIFFLYAIIIANILAFTYILNKEKRYSLEFNVEIGHIVNNQQKTRYIDYGKTYTLLNSFFKNVKIKRNKKAKSILLVKLKTPDLDKTKKKVINFIKKVNSYEDNKINALYDIARRDLDIIQKQKDFVVEKSKVLERRIKDINNKLKTIQKTDMLFSFYLIQSSNYNQQLISLESKIMDLILLEKQNDTQWFISKTKIFGDVKSSEKYVEPNEVLVFSIFNFLALIGTLLIILGSFFRKRENK